MVMNSPKAARKTPPGPSGASRAGSASPTSALDRWFEITRRGSTVGQEVRGGLVTFFTMAYIVALNPIIIGSEADRNGNLISGVPKYLDAARTQVDWAAVGDAKMMVAVGTALVAGLTGPEIARRLFVSHNTLRTHTKHIFAKLGVTSRSAAAAFAYEHDLA